MSNMSIILVALLSVSEALALIPGVKANSIFQLIVGMLSGLGSASKP